MPSALPADFDGQVAAIATRLITDGVRPTVRAVVALHPESSHTKTSGALRAFWRRGFARILGLPAAAEPNEEETSALRLAASSGLTADRRMVLAYEGAVLQVDLDHLVRALAENAETASPADGGGIVLTLSDVAAVSLRLSPKEYEFLAGRAAAVRREGSRP